MNDKDRIKNAKKKYTAYGVVRDKNGKPRIGDIHNILPQIWEMLTDEEQTVILQERIDDLKKKPT